MPTINNDREVDLLTLRSLGRRLPSPLTEEDHKAVWGMLLEIARAKRRDICAKEIDPSVFIFPLCKMDSRARELVYETWSFQALLYRVFRKLCNHVPNRPCSDIFYRWKGKLVLRFTVHSLESFPTEQDLQEQIAFAILDLRKLLVDLSWLNLPWENFGYPDRCVCSPSNWDDNSIALMRSLLRTLVHRPIFENIGHGVLYRLIEIRCGALEGKKEGIDLERRLLPGLFGAVVLPRR